MAVLILGRVLSYTCVCDEAFLGRRASEMVLEVKRHHGVCREWTQVDPQNRHEFDFVDHNLGWWLERGSRLTEWRMENLLPRAARLWTVIEQTGER